MRTIIFDVPIEKGTILAIKSRYKTLKYRGVEQSGSSLGS